MVFFCLLLCNGCSQKPDEKLHKSQVAESSAVLHETESSSEIIIDAPSADPETVPATREEWLPYCERYDFNIRPLSAPGFISQGIIYSGLNPWEDYKTTDCEVTINEITVNEVAANEITENETAANETAINETNAREASGKRKALTIHLTATMWEEYTRDGQKLWECMTPTLQLCDYYTGLIFPERDTKGTDSFEAQAHLEYEDKSYEVNYSCEVAYSQGDWESDPDGGYRRPATFEIVYKIIAPKEYDGLMICVTPVTEYYPADVSEPAETECYIKENSREILLYKIEVQEDEDGEHYEEKTETQED